MSKYTPKTQTAFFSDEKILNLEQIYNSHNDVVHVPKKMRNVEVPDERLFCDIEAFHKEMMVYAAILKAVKTSVLNGIQR